MCVLVCAQANMTALSVELLVQMVLGVASALRHMSDLRLVHRVRYVTLRHVVVDGITVVTSRESCVDVNVKDGLIDVA